MKRMTKYFAALLIILLAGSLLPVQITQAASAGITITTDNTEITVGESLSVYITIDSDTSFGDFEANLTYDEEILEYQGDNPTVAGSSGFLRIKDTNVSEGEFTRKYALEFKAVKVGACDITFSNPIMVYDYETGIEMAVSIDELTVNVIAATTASDNAYLSSLKISPSELTPKFDKNVYNYNTIVDYKTDKLIVDATREDAKSVIKIFGNDSLKEGENKIIVTVIAESGDVIEYTINVFREFAPKADEQDENDLTPTTRHGSFEVVEMDDELFAVYNGKYKLVEPGAEIAIPRGYIKTRIIISDKSIPVYAPENNLEFDFILIYAENELGEAGFYSYDRVERTLQRYTQENPFGSVEVVDNIPESGKAREYRNNMMKAAIVIALLSILSALLVVLVIRLNMKSNHSRKRSRRK